MTILIALLICGCLTFGCSKREPAAGSRSHGAEFHGFTPSQSFNLLTNGPPFRAIVVAKYFSGEEATPPAPAFVTLRLPSGTNIVAGSSRAGQTEISFIKDLQIGRD